ncbi:NUDIX hydrolase [Ornithinibacillus bavariensis]|uniref:DNA mismatch repair protein MutT n=1 Tax=Ornithinibacillus bavariensis TaxID=545502 RepID=A0A919X848_9BACI|nr:NUDIX hydrolase [Ornithinibacillus bavariensis]GIO25863.1 DNA mismatch repair protein MutT [Ornithinibacillus bavariensis]HAM79729.1 DNA mismatch repair protein MutT [Ornithinibacillus sp.]
MGYVEDLRKLVGHRPLIFVGAVLVIEDNNGRILLQQRKFPNGKWGIPGGLMELGESTEEVARRELLEETGLIAGELHLINVYSGKDHFIKAENGDEFYVVTVAYYTNEYSGILKVDQTESINFEFFYPHDFPENMVGSHFTILQEYLKGRSK